VSETESFTLPRLAAADGDGLNHARRLRRRRLLLKTAFFALFVLAPPLDLFRFDLEKNNLILFGMDWTLGFPEYHQGLISLGELTWNLLWKAFLPVLGAGALLLTVAWRWGRLYCGWLCPHFSVVEAVNALMTRAIGRPSLWEKFPLPRTRADGRPRSLSRWYWIPTLAAILGFAFLWAVSFLTYLLPPAEIYHNLFHGQLTPNQFRFLAVATAVFTIEFAFARHLFCRFGCAVGIFQSLAWMANRNALVIGFDRRRAAECRDCNNACDNACPARLKPRTLKRKMFTCTQCVECIAACTQVEARKGRRSLLHWVDGSCARHKIDGKDHDVACF